MRGKPYLDRLKDKHGNVKSRYWYVFFYDGKRSRRVSTGCEAGTQDHEANIFLATFTLEREQPVARAPDKLMIAQALTDYYEEHAQFVTSAANARSHEARINEYFPGMFVSQLTPATQRAYIRTCEEQGRSAGTVRRELAHLQAAINHEVEEQRMTHAPKIIMPEPPAARERVFTDDEIARMLEASKTTPHLQLFLRIMIETGQRPIAIESLTWFQVDFKAREIHFHKTQRKSSKKKCRTVAMTDSLYSLLKQVHARKGDTGYVVEYTIVKKDGSRAVRKAGSVRRSFEKACARAKIKKVKGQGRYTLRHTFGDALDRAGVDDKIIADILGHTKVQTTRKHYLKKNIKKQRDAMHSAQVLRKSKRGKNA